MFRIYFVFILFAFRLIFSQSNPQLIIDTKGHTAPVSGMFFINNGENLLSVSQDKTIRIWDTESGQLKRTLRINIGNDVIGSIYCADYHPSADLLALGGYLAPKTTPSELGKIILIKISSGEIVDELHWHRSTINTIKFSAEGNFLFAGDSDGKLSMWSKNGNTYGYKNNTEAHLQGVNSIAITTKHVITGGEDGMVKRWKLSPAGLSTGETSNHHSAKIIGVAATKNGEYAASISEDKKMILYNTRFEPEKELSELNLAVIEFDESGTKLMAGGENPNTVKIYSVPDLNLFSQFTKHESLVSAITHHQDLIASAGGNNFDIFLWRENTPGQSEHLVGKGSPKLALGIDREMNIAYSEKLNINENQLNSAVLQKGINLDKFTILSNPSNTKFQRETIKFSYFDLKKISDNQLQIDENTMIEIPEKNDMIRTFTYTKEGDIAIGSDFSLELYSGKGDYLKTFEGHNGSVWSAVVSEDNKFLVSCGDDQTIRFWNLDAKGEYESAWEYYSGNNWQAYFTKKGLTSLSQKRGKTAWFDLIQKIKQLGDKDVSELQEDIENLRCIVKPSLSLFISSDNEWVMWTNEGYYSASAGGEKFIGWQINSSENKLAQFYPSSAFRNQFFKPEMIRSILNDPNAPIVIENQNKAVENASSNKIDKNISANEPISILNSLPPKITFLYPNEYKTTVIQDKIKIKLKIKSDKKITGVKVFVNGVKYGSESNKPKNENIVFREVNSNLNDSLFEFEIKMTQKENTIMVYAANENGNSISEEKIIELNQQKKENAEELIIKPNLYMLSIGISKFLDGNNNLDFADDDAREMSKLFKDQKGLLYNDVQVKELTDADATRLNILDAFSWLERNVTNKDIAIIFIATHGFNQKDKFYILPADGEYDKYRATCVDWSDFGEILKNLPCRTVLFLDACHSGQLGKNLYATRGAADDNTEAIRELASDESGIVILSASTGAEKSLESKAWGHGAFTYSVLSAVKTREGDINKNNFIHLNELEYYIAENVKKLTDGQQHTTTQKPSTISSLPLFQLIKK